MGIAMYSIKGIDSIFDLMAYTIDAMHEAGIEEIDVDDYISSSLKENNYNIVELSKDYLEECNSKSNKRFEDNDDWFEDTWRDHYYSSLYEDEDDCEIEFEPEVGSYWDRENGEDEEAYEGFESCDKRYWDSSSYDDDTADEEWKLKGYTGYLDFEEPTYDPFNDGT
jgi:hypothetical protein